MRTFLATASCDWGFIYSNEQIKASQWSTAFNRAGKMAKERARKRPRTISINLRAV